MSKTFDSESRWSTHAATPGAIGYVGKGTKHDKVETLTIK
jgi:hypothetical protein